MIRPPSRAFGERAADRANTVPKNQATAETPESVEANTVPRQMERIDRAVAVLADAINQFKPQWVFALFSGGGDSRTASYVASLHGVDACVFIDTGIGIPATRQHVIDTCDRQGWSLKEYKATENTKADGTPDPQIYEDIVMRLGFPGAFGHRMMYSRLKERQLRRLRREHPGKVMFISGSRAQESERRMRHTKKLQVAGDLAWCAPVWDWSKPECSEVLASAKIAPNDAALRFGRSGECLCGAFAKPGELAALEFACPKSAQRIHDLEKRVKTAGFPWGWEQGPPQWWLDEKRGQLPLFNSDALIEERLCTSCKWRAL